MINDTIKKNIVSGLLIFAIIVTLFLTYKYAYFKGVTDYYSEEAEWRERYEVVQQLQSRTTLLLAKVTEKYSSCVRDIINLEIELEYEVEE